MAPFTELQRPQPEQPPTLPDRESQVPEEFPEEVPMQQPPEEPLPPPGSLLQVFAAAGHALPPEFEEGEGRGQ